MVAKRVPPGSDDAVRRAKRGTACASLRGRRDTGARAARPQREASSIRPSSALLISDSMSTSTSMRSATLAMPIR